jgi:NAD(P)-dependent dehydrogenase (short-subunit alcohol dehydrogenase family)
LTLEDFRRQFETNVFGVLRTVIAAREHLIAAKGCLAIIGSMNGIFAMPGASPYCMSKFALSALASSLWYELRPSGVGVVYVAPGFVRSEIRQIDNRGVRHPHAGERIPTWLSVSSERAGRKIVDALIKRPQVKVITRHAHVGVFFQRHFPRFFSAVMYAFRARRRRK